MEKYRNITLPASELPSERQKVLSIHAPSAESAVVSVAASHQGAYRVCERITEFFYTVRTELWLTVRALRSVFRRSPKRERLLIPAACCGYSRTILGWRL